MQSGSALSPWGMTIDPLERAQELCKKLGFEGTDPYEMLQYLKKQSVEDISKAAKVMNDESKMVWHYRLTHKHTRYPKSLATRAGK